MKSTTHKRALFRPWLWIQRIFYGLTQPVPPGLWLVNFIFQKILDVNSDIPWMVNFTSRVTGNVVIGKNVEKSFAISGHCYIQGNNGIVIDDDTIFAPGVNIISANHDTSSIENSVLAEPVRIGKKCWLGANSVILPRVQLGDGVIVGAGSVVTKSFPGGVVIAGVPAKIIRDLKNNLP